MGFKTFEDLDVYKYAREMRKMLYGIAKRLPDKEKYNLASQMRRAAVSLTNNIAEGHGRYHYQENIQFMRQARGSLEELFDDLNICLDEAYIDAENINKIRAHGNNVRMLINGYIKFLQKRKAEQ